MSSDLHTSSWLLNFDGMKEKCINDPEGFPNSFRALSDNSNHWPGHPLTRLMSISSLTEPVVKECVWLYESWNAEFLLSLL